jgi:hypothetical protein
MKTIDRNRYEIDPRSKKIIFDGDENDSLALLRSIVDDDKDLLSQSITTEKTNDSKKSKITSLRVFKCCFGFFRSWCNFFRKNCNFSSTSLCHDFY